MGWDAISTIVASVGRELGLGTLAAAYPATDVNVLMLQALIDVTGRKLVKQHPWLQQKLEHTFSTTATTTFTMPAGMQSVIDGTGWNRTTKKPLHFASPQEWQNLKASGTTVFGQVEVVRLIHGTTFARTTTMEFPATATASQTVAFEYRSNLWVRPNAGGTNLDAPTATNDWVAIESLLFTRALKLRWLQDRGLPSEAAQRDFDEVLETERSANAMAKPTLRLGGHYSGLAGPNVPESGYGL